MRVAALFVVATLLLPSDRQLSPCAPQFVPLQTGSTYGDSDERWWPADALGEWRGSGWLGWVHDGDGVLPVALQVRERRSRDAEEVEVTIDATPRVDFLVRCVPGLAQQAMRALAVVNHSLSRGNPLP